MLTLCSTRSAVFQAGGLVVVLAEVSRRAYLASIVPVIVNAILNEHQIIVDIVAFVNRGDFPRSRLGEKQRGKILAGWVSRKMRTMAQFAIKDMDGADIPGGGPGVPDAPGSAMGEGRHSFGSLRGAGPGPMVGTSSLRNMEHAPQILEQRELEEGYYPAPHHGPPPTSMAAPIEMPAEEHERIFGMPNAPPPPGGLADPDTTPTKPARISVAPPPHGFELPDFDHFGPSGDDDDSPPPPAVGPKPGTGAGAGPGPEMHNRLSQGPGMRLPGVDGRESMDDWSPAPGATDPSEEDWTRDAIMHMNLAGDLQRREGTGR
jgi:hypothetical protein